MIENIIKQFNKTKKDYPEDKCFHHLFELWVENVPEKIAVAFEDQFLTYRELNNRANCLANYLIKLDVTPETLVGIYVEKSLETIIGILAILKAGGAYLPLDPTYPQERLAYMVEDSQINLLLTQKKLIAEFSNYQGQIICLNEDWSAQSEEESTNPNTEVQSDNLAYIIYTSGSTGKPKGVMLTHQGLCNLATAQTTLFNVTPESRILQFASLSFDASVWEIAMALGSGASIHLGKSDSLLPGPNLVEFLNCHNITHLTISPSALLVMPQEKLQYLKTVIVAGEACSVRLIEQWSPGRRFFNAYGPTESTVCATVGQCTMNDRLTIGRPIANTNIYILDEELQPTQIGVAGEIYISGVGLARGYFNRPDLTAERFINNPFVEEEVDYCQTTANPYSRMYKTGDWGTYLPDGRIEFLGRKDYQVKIRGHRLEIGEIEAVLSQNPDLSQVTVVDKEGKDGNKYLIAYYLSDRVFPSTSQQLREFLRNKLPEYSIPSFFVRVEKMPLTVNGKVDRNALKAIAISDQIVASNITTPRNQTEEKLLIIWQEVLELTSISVTDNFFDIGGNSLLALTVLQKIETVFSCQLPSGTLFQASTIEKIANIIDGQENLELAYSIVPIRPQGSLPPLFLIHYVQKNLVTYLSPQQPVYALRYGLGGSSYRNIDVTLPKTIESLATHYIQQMQTIQPNGPYLLAGSSVGGIIAWEMAQQLKTQGEEVGLLGLFDTILPEGVRPLSKLEVIQQLFQVHPKIVCDRLVRSIRDYFRDFQHNNQYIPQVHSGEDYLFESYTPKPYKGNVLLFNAVDKFAIFYKFVSPRKIWSNLVIGNLEIYEIPGDHISLMAEPNVRLVGKKLQSYINSLLI